MSRLLRITVTWLLALALPLQGYAAQAVPEHGMTHQAGMMMTSSHPMHAHGDAAGAAAQHDTDCCDKGVAHGPAHSATTHAKCSACASSCGAVAIAMPSLSIEVASQGVTMVATVAAASGHFLTGGIERPPRRSPA